MSLKEESVFHHLCPPLEKNSTDLHPLKKYRNVNIKMELKSVNEDHDDSSVGRI